MQRFFQIALFGLSALAAGVASADDPPGLSEGCIHIADGAQFCDPDGEWNIIRETDESKILSTTTGGYNFFLFTLADTECSKTPSVCKKELEDESFGWLANGKERNRSNVKINQLNIEGKSLTTISFTDTGDNLVQSQTIMSWHILDKRIIGLTTVRHGEELLEEDRIFHARTISLLKPLP